MKKTLLEPKYNHQQVEQGKYQMWLDHKYFESGDLAKKPYTIVIPPPNVTGALHLGHAWDTTLQDIIARKKRMEGYDMLWLPGMDHAGIATQARVEARLKTQGLSRYDLGREEFLKVAWAWKDEFALRIKEQWAALGLSVDYQKERFTLDEKLNEAVNKVFIDLYNEGLIYRGERIINWDVQSKTALSNIEVDYKEIEGAYYHFLYPYVGEVGGLVIVTTRPETMFGDVALMVHPDDQRYQDAIGKMVYIPGTTRQIPVITDTFVDQTFGTGVVKVTPAHDPNDFEVGIRHQLPQILCMNEDGTMNEWAGIYEGLDRFKCRSEVVKNLIEKGLCLKVEKMIHQVGHSERTNVIIEPRLSKQWFVSMKQLADDVLKMQATDEKINFIPERFHKTFNTWLENIQDWCISRQLWWGHRIPAWYKGNEVFVGINRPGADWIQDEDVLDTWFSSALWPFSAFGWPDETSDLKRYFPTDTLITGYDLIFFWIARMAFQSKHFMNVRPFKNCYLHGLIRDEEGKKMSKSLGNGIDPFDLINEFGCDAMRYFLTTNSAPGLDLRYSNEKMASSWNYINKIWNISRYIQMNLQHEAFENSAFDQSLMSNIDEWLLKKVNDLVSNVNYLYEQFEFGEVARLIYNFVWDDFASWYVELSKVVFMKEHGHAHNTCALLKDTLIIILKLLHPFMPFVTEEIYSHFENGSIMISSWPVPQKLTFSPESINNVEQLMLIINAIRNIRAEKNVSLTKAINIGIETSSSEFTSFLDIYQVYLKKMINFESLSIASSLDRTDAIVIVLSNFNIVIPTKELLNLEDEKARLLKEKDKLTNELIRSHQMLSNANFLAKAPREKINNEKEKLSKYQKQLNEVNEILTKLSVK